MEEYSRVGGPYRVKYTFRVVVVVYFRPGTPQTRGVVDVKTSNQKDVRQGLDLGPVTLQINVGTGTVVSTGGGRTTRTDVSTPGESGGSTDPIEVFPSRRR